MPRWISVKEKLPEEDTSVLVSTRVHDIFDPTVIWRRGVISIEKLYILPDGTHAWSNRKQGEVTHWMPLPEPPKGE